jgi:hypothetical protein
MADRLPFVGTLKPEAMLEVIADPNTTRCFQYSATSLERPNLELVHGARTIEIFLGHRPPIYQLFGHNLSSIKIVNVLCSQTTQR